MAKTSRLARKGTPPKRETTINVIAADPRETEGKTYPLQVQLPADVLSAFNREANERFDHKKGAKSRFFLEMWDLYRQHKT